MWLKTVHCCHLRLRMKSRYEQGASAPRHPRQRDVRRTSKQRGRLARSCCRRLLRCKSPLGCLLIACDPERGCHEVTGVKRCLHKRNKLSLAAGLISFVEMGGLEPPSKHRTRELSTRLVLLWFSTRGCRRTGHPRLIL